MSITNHTSLGDQVSRKISNWILILVLTIIAVIFLIAFFLSRQMFNNQIRTWDKLIPQYTLTSLIDSDSFSIKRDLKFIESSGLFSSFVILDNQKRKIASFGHSSSQISSLTPIQDEGGVIWGYYFFKADFYHFFSPFLISAVLFFTLVSLLYFTIRLRIRSALEAEFKRFNDFLNEIEKVTEKLHEVYNEELVLAPSQQYNSEQIIINRAIGRLFKEIRTANKSLREAISINEQRRFQEELTKTALQVAHDIGSPLAVLEAMVQSTSINLQEKSRVTIRNAATRIRDITYSLLKKGKHSFVSNSEQMPTQQLIQSLINQVLSEKRLQFGSKIDIDFKLNETSYGLFSFVRAGDFCRVLSNIINNSIEAIIDNNLISVLLRNQNNNIVLEIKDSGKGIPSHIMTKIGNLGATFGKPEGFGMGLYHAKRTVEEYGGQIEIESKENIGTVVKLYLPQAKVPFWFVSEIKLTDDQVIIIIDDDESIHTIWKERFAQFEYQSNKTINLIHFYSPEQLINWEYPKKIEKNILYFCDYEFLDSALNGIELITQLKINYLSILVTSRANSDDVISSCEAANIKLLPKDMANYVPLVGWV